MYQRLLARGKSKQKALIAVARKLLVLIWNMLSKKGDEKEAQKQQEDRENTKKSDKKDNEQIKPSLTHVPIDNHLRIKTKTGQEHLHLHDGCILCLIKDNKGIL